MESQTKINIPKKVKTPAPKFLHLLIVGLIAVMLNALHRYWGMSKPMTYFLLSVVIISVVGTLHTWLIMSYKTYKLDNLIAQIIFTILAAALGFFIFLIGDNFFQLIIPQSEIIKSEKMLLLSTSWLVFLFPLFVEQTLNAYKQIPNRILNIYQIPKESKECSNSKIYHQKFNIRLCQGSQFLIKAWVNSEAQLIDRFGSTLALANISGNSISSETGWVFYIITWWGAKIYINPFQQTNKSVIKGTIYVVAMKTYSESNSKNS